MLDRISINRAINGDYGASSRKDGNLVDVRYELEKHFSDSLDYEADAVKNGEKQELLVIHDSKDPYVKKIKSRPSQSFNRGDIWECYGEKYLVTEVDPNNQMLTEGIMEQCNYILPFQLDSSEIYYEPCIVNDKTTLDTGEKDGKVITIPDTRKVITVQYNECTSKLKTGKRIFVDALVDDAKVYKITEIERVTKMQNGKGLWILKCDEEAVNHEFDRADLLIANYISTTPSAPDPSNCEIVYTGNAEIRVGGSTKTFTAKFYDINGDELAGIEPVWSINDTYSGKIEIKEQFDNKVKIGVSAGDGLVGNSFKLILKDTSNIYSCDLEVRMVPIW